MGYSDLTGCFTAIHEKTGLITFHGYLFNQKRLYLIQI